MTKYYLKILCIRCKGSKQINDNQFVPKGAKCHECNGKGFARGIDITEIIRISVPYMTMMDFHSYIQELKNKDLIEVVEE